MPPPPRRAAALVAVERCYELGLGLLAGMGHSNLCRQRSTGALCALLRRCAAMQHPNVVTLRDVMRGGDLRNYIASSAGFSDDEVWALWSQLARGLAYLHKEGIAHRD
eukprot:gene18361-21268_t